VSKSKFQPSSDLFESLSNWGRWGADDELGTLNFCGEAETLRSLRCVRSGEVISCSREISPQQNSDDRSPASHQMLSSGETAPAHGLAVATDRIGVAFHGYSVTHLDSLGHIFWNQLGYNGVAASTVSMSFGAMKGSIEAARNGIVTRGVLFDMPRVLSVDWLEPGHAISPEELDQAEALQGVRVGPGDVLFIRTGRDTRAVVHGQADPSTYGAPGLHISCLPWIRERSISVLGSDSVNDVMPSGVDDMICPIHTIGLVAMGLWLVDNVHLETLSERCAQRASWEFLAMMSPLVFSAATGSPVNPLAIL
jgi:kynurenine formamidase